MQSSAHASPLAYEKSPHLTNIRTRRMIADTLRAVVEEIFARKGSCTVLDLGAGHGTFTDELLLSGATVVASEMSEESANRLRSRYRHNGNIEVIHDRDGETVFTRGDQFDAVVCVSVLHHIPDYLGTVARLIGIVSDGGAFVSFQDPMLYATLSRPQRLFYQGSFYIWRLAQGDIRRGIKTTLRRLRGVLDEENPSDMVEYHVVRDGMDQDALAELLRGSFRDVRVVPYLSTPLRIFQHIGDQLGVNALFGTIAKDKQPSR